MARHISVQSALVVDQEKDAILRCQQSVQADLRERLHHVFLSFLRSTHLSEALAQLGYEQLGLLERGEVTAFR